MVQLRSLTDDDLPALRSVDGWAFGMSVTDSRWQVASAVLERDRQLGAFDDGSLVGHSACLSHVLTIPGGTVPAAGVTWVGVQPSHRRRGVMSALLRRQLTELAEQREPVATLWAAEPAIYGRFGFGVASRRLVVTAPAGTALAGDPPRARRLALADVPDVLEDCQQVYETLRPQLPGMVTRSVEAWKESSHDDPADRSGASPLRCAVAYDELGRPDGYVWFRTQPKWEDGTPHGTVHVHELLAGSADAARMLLGVVLDLDLMTSTHLWNLTLDDRLLALTEHTARLRVGVLDQLWARLVRVDDALSARAYGGAIDMVLDVTDETLPHNAGRWRLAADATGAEVSRTRAAPDLHIDVRTLSGAYLGDDALVRATLAGLLEEHTPGSAEALARAMRGDRAPHCPYMF